MEYGYAVRGCWRVSMWRQVLAPIHPDGWKFVAIAAVVTLVLFLLWSPAGWVGVIATLWMAYFFRDPWRVTPTRPGLIVSPADGIVAAIAPAPPPPELDMGDAPVPRISIFLNLFDVHVARTPVGGRVAARRYTKGLFRQRQPRQGQQRQRAARDPHRAPGWRADGRTSPSC